MRKAILCLTIAILALFVISVFAQEKKEEKKEEKEEAPATDATGTNETVRLHPTIVNIFRLQAEQKITSYSQPT